MLESRRYCSIPLSMKGLLWAVALSSRPRPLAQNHTYFCAPWGRVLNCCFQSERNNNRSSCRGNASWQPKTDNKDKNNTLNTLNAERAPPGTRQMCRKMWNFWAAKRRQMRSVCKFGHEAERKKTKKIMKQTTHATTHRGSKRKSYPLDSPPWHDNGLIMSWQIITLHSESKIKVSFCYTAVKKAQSISSIIPCFCHIDKGNLGEAR